MKKLIIFILVVFGALIISSAVGSFTGKFFKGAASPKVAVIKVKGVIKSSDKYLKLLKRAEESPKVKAIVLRVDSPGGVVGACQEIYEKVKKVKEKKPVVVSMGSVAASGGLYISVGASKIVANPGTITGSIGVILQTYNVRKLAEKIGVEVITVKSGRFKDLLNPFKEPDPESIKIVQQLIDDSYRQFVEAVAEGRNLPVEKVKEFADGRIFTGRQAKELGLVDYLGGFERAVEVAKELGKCPNATLWEIKERKNPLERLLGSQNAAGLKNFIRALVGDVKEVNLMYILD